MKAFIFILLFLSTLPVQAQLNESSESTEWSDSIQQGWDKSKQYGAEAWQATKNTTRELLELN